MKEWPWLGKLSKATGKKISL